MEINFIDLLSPLFLKFEPMQLVFIVSGLFVCQRGFVIIKFAAQNNFPKGDMSKWPKKKKRILYGYIGKKLTFPAFTFVTSTIVLMVQQILIIINS